MIFSSDQIEKATACPRGNVVTNWPYICNALEDAGISSKNVEIAAAATVAVETGIFKPLKERQADLAKQPALAALQARYYPSGYYGRGFIQLTWKDNYQKYAQLTGVDLVGNPDLLLQPHVSAQVLALFFQENHIDVAANDQDWRKVRKLVNGGLMGWDYYSKIICKLTMGVDDGLG